MKIKTIGKRNSMVKIISLMIVFAIMSGISAINMTAMASEMTVKEDVERSQDVNSRQKTLSSEAPTVSVYINGNRLTENSFLINDTTYVPLRAYVDAVDDCDIGWKNGVASVKSNTVNMTVTQYSNYIEANGRYLYSASEIRNINDRIYVPIRLLAKAYTMDVEWEGSTKTVYLAGDPKPLKRGEEYYDADDLYWLSRIIHAESGGEILLGKIAVGNVVINRMNNKNYPNTIYGVIFDKKHGTQFSPVAFGTIHNTPSAESIKAAKICLDGYSLNDEMIFFINPKIATNFWITNTRTFVVRVGNHMFYK